MPFWHSRTRERPYQYGAEAMHELFDDMARLVASPMPRKQALRLIGGMLVGSVGSLLWPSRVQAQVQAQCGGKVPPQVCRAGPSNVTCCYADEMCCGRNHPQSASCCAPGTYCRPPGQVGPACL